MIYFAQVGYLLLILLIPLMFIAYWLMRRIRKKRIARFGDPELVDRAYARCPETKRVDEAYTYLPGPAVLCRRHVAAPAGCDSQGEGDQGG